MNVKDAGDLLGRMRGRRVVVVGDLMLDRYVFGSVSRISPEAPVPVVLVQREEIKPGGAANVARNIRALGGEVSIAGFVGDDQAGADLRRILAEGGIGTGAVVVRPGMQTTVKTRVVADRQQVVRVDREDPPARTSAASRELLPAVERELGQADGAILEDYGKGLLTQPVVDVVIAAAKRRGIPVGLDPKDTRSLRIKGLALATPNYKEACLNAGLGEVPLSGDLLAHANLAEAGRRLQELWETDTLAITLGAHGMYCLPRGGSPAVIPTRAREVFDVTGAGDTVIAAALTAMAAGADALDAAGLANYAAGVVVGKLGAATCTPAELIDYINSVSSNGGKGARA
jgi:D-beta-D-heptose 7-phosphate kinase/D-beta-D-heptose 1-phosphate adenosyltransferase